MLCLLYVLTCWSKKNKRKLFFLTKILCKKYPAFLCFLILWARVSLFFFPFSFLQIPPVCRSPLYCVKSICLFFHITVWENTENQCNMWSVLTQKEIFWECTCMLSFQLGQTREWSKKSCLLYRWYWWLGVFKSLWCLDSAGRSWIERLKKQTEIGAPG